MSLDFCLVLFEPAPNLTIRKSQYHYLGNLYEVNRMNWPVHSFLLTAGLRKAANLPLSVIFRILLTYGSSPFVYGVSGWPDRVGGFLFKL
jgi:hypothetical protein